MTKYIIYWIIMFNYWLDNQKKLGNGPIITVGLILPAVATMTYTTHWELLVASVFFLAGLFFVRFVWIVMAQDLIKYVKERT